MSKIISQKKIHKAVLFEVVETKIELPEGKSAINEDIYIRPSIFVFPITPKKEIYLIYEDRYLLGKTVLSAVAGFIEKGENSLAAAKRELKEEAGLTANLWEEILRVESANSVVKSPSYLFLAQDLKKMEKNPEIDEKIQLVKMTLDEAIEKIIIGEITDAKSITGLFLLEKLKREKRI